MFDIDAYTVPMQPPYDAVEVQPYVPPAWRGKGGGKGALPARSRIVAKGGLAWVELSQGLWAVVCESDVQAISHACWSAHRVKTTIYAVARVSVNGGVKRQVGMHQLLLGMPKGRVIDHRNLNGLDNRRGEQLRVCTISQNMQNGRRNSRNTTGYKGVHFNSARKTFVAMIRVNGKKTYLGRYDDPKAAYRAYCEAARKHFGHFARVA